ncbi:MAG: hypothetical protein KJZ58_12380 [Flavobacteriales bacterium]|nr:hypothetical protein [Flavobacteriales bacterium]MCL4283046.1 hypothetical protein [Flavobacteriales bacterium]
MAIFATQIRITMPQDSRTQANRRRKAAEKLAKWKEANAGKATGKAKAGKKAKQA